MTTTAAPSLVADVLSRGEQLWDFDQQVRRVGGCEQPIRLRGRAEIVNLFTGEVRKSWSSETLPDGTVLVACGNRRATRCAPCARLYQGDAFQLVVAGLRGGKTVPETVVEHPAVFVTLTAPGFGSVHTAGLTRDARPAPCRVRRDLTGQTCQHGQPLVCRERHVEGDPELGSPLCADCFDYEAAVLWNAHASELWRPPASTCTGSWPASPARPNGRSRRRCG